MSIDIKTLRIGSHVLAYGTRVQVDGMDMPRPQWTPKYPLIRCKAVVDGKTRYCGCNSLSDEIQPIPITPALLEELGFEWREDSSCWRKEVGDDVWLFVNGKEEQGFRFSLFPPFKKGIQEPILYARHLHEIEGQLAYYEIELIKEQE